VDDPIEAGKIFKGAGAANVTVTEPDAPLLKRLTIHLTTGTRKIVDSVNLKVRSRFGKGTRQAATDEAPGSGDQDLHKISINAKSTRRCAGKAIVPGLGNFANRVG